MREAFKGFTKLGHTHEGIPIWSWKNAKRDKRFSTDQHVRYMLMIIERHNLIETKFVLVFDRQECKIDRKDIKVFIRLAQVINNYYPDIFHTCLVFPAGSFVRSVWKLVSKFLDERSKAKCIFLKTIEEGNQKLLEMLPEI